jgi:hypothetical protein
MFGLILSYAVIGTFVSISTWAFSTLIINNIQETRKYKKK